MKGQTSEEKRIRQAEKKHVQNKSYISKMKTQIKKVKSCQTRSEAEALLPETFATIDSIARKGIIHKNNAANKKSRLVSFINKLP